MNDERHTLYVGRVHPKVTEEILFELFLQVGPLLKVVLPKKERGETAHKGFAFVEFKHQVSLDYAIAVLSGESLYGQQLIIKHKNKPKESEDVNNASVNDSASNNQVNNNDKSQQGFMSFDSVAKMIEMQRNSSNQSFNQQSFNQYSNGYNNMSDASLVNAAFNQQQNQPPLPPTSQLNDRPPLPPTPKMNPPSSHPMQDSRSSYPSETPVCAAPRQQYNNSYIQSYHQQNSTTYYPQQNSPANYHNSSRDHKSYRNDSRYAPYNSNESNNYHGSKDYDRNGSGRSYAGGDARNVEVSSNRRRSYLPGPYESRGNSRGSRRY